MARASSKLARREVDVGGSMANPCVRLCKYLDGRRTVLSLLLRTVCLQTKRWAQTSSVYNVKLSATPPGVFEMFCVVPQPIRIKIKHPNPTGCHNYSLVSRHSWTNVGICSAVAHPLGRHETESCSTKVSESHSVDRNNCS